MKTNYELTRDDLAAFVDYHQRSSPAAWRQKFGCLFVAFCLLLALPVWTLLTTKKPLLETAIATWPLLVCPMLFAVLASPYIRWRTKQMTNRLLSEGQNKGFYGQCELETTDDSIIETRLSGTTIRNWNSVERIVVTPSHLFVYTSGIEAFVVPRYAFATEVEFENFLETITQRSGVVTYASS